MSNIELLEYARLNYPDGTEFITIFNQIPHIVDGNYFTIMSNTGGCDKDRVIIKVKGKTDTSDGTVAIYSKEKGWAKIIKKGEPTYEIY